MKKIIYALVLIAIISVTGCSDAMVTSSNISRAADQFEIYRRVVFYNGITDQYILMVEGYSSINKSVEKQQFEIIVKTDDGQYMKHFLGLSDNVTYFAEQIEPSKVRSDKYRVIFKPSAIVPDIDLR
jgi:hypothetical protein